MNKNTSTARKIIIALLVSVIAIYLLNYFGVSPSFLDGISDFIGASRRVAKEPVEDIVVVEGASPIVVSGGAGDGEIGYVSV